MEKFSSEDRNPQCETERDGNEQCGGNILTKEPLHFLKPLIVSRTYIVRAIARCDTHATDVSISGGNPLFNCRPVVIHAHHTEYRKNRLTQNSPRVCIPIRATLPA
jgi:hypothetical protein